MLHACNKQILMLDGHLLDYISLNIGIHALPVSA